MASPEAKALNEQLIALRDQIMGSGERPPLDEQRKSVDSMGQMGSEPTGVTTKEVVAGQAPALLHEPESGGNGWIHLHCHGGGLVMGSAAAWSRWLGHLAVKSGWSVLNLDFRRAPEDPFPASLEDARAAVDWLISEGYPAEKIVLGGDSAGSTLALGTAQTLRDEGISVAGIVLLSPWIDFTLENPTIEGKRSTDALCGPETLAMMREFYLSNGEDPKDPKVSPAYADLRGLAPMHIEASKEEILLDDAMRLAENAEAAGVSVETKWWEVVPHVHQLFVGAIPESDESIDLISGFLGKLAAK